MSTLPEMVLRPGSPNFKDLPWFAPLTEWERLCIQLEEVPRGLSRHPVVFIHENGTLYALKELSPEGAEKEFTRLCQIEALHLPAVTPVGYIKTQTRLGQTSVLITRYLEGSLPYRMLFLRQGLESYRKHLLDAIAGLLVQLHLALVYWGDCSLSNTLFRRDAGALQAYLVDAETVECYEKTIPPAMRMHDLQIMEENITGELLDMRALNNLPRIDPGIPIANTGAYIRLSYQRLWDEITREEVINPDEHYRIQERIRTLHAMGFSVGDIELTPVVGGNQLRLRVAVTDRNFHRYQLHNLTGLDAEEKQARQLMNEIHELRATLSQENQSSTTLSMAAQHWLEHFYLPIVKSLEPLMDGHTTPAELYCQVLEHKWYLSEQACHDVGHTVAVEDFLQRFGNKQTQPDSI